MNAIGQRTGVTTSGTAYPAIPSWLWGYDSLGQIIAADSTVAISDHSDQYDTNGYRQKSADSVTLPVANNYTTNALNQYTSSSVGGSLTLNPLYDFEGNMTSGPLPTARTVNGILVWDGENRLIRSTVGSVTTGYKYDAQSHRIAKIAGIATTSAATIYLYAAWNCIVDYSGSAGVSPTFTLKKTRLWGTDLSNTPQAAGGVASLLSESLISNTQSPIYYSTYDGNGNIVVNTDTGNLFTYRFSTKPRDIETGLYYYGYRYYDSMTGRWLSRDPIGKRGGMNLYRFPGNNGIVRIDRLNLFEIDIVPPPPDLPDGDGEVDDSLLPEKGYFLCSCTVEGKYKKKKCPETSISGSGTGREKFETSASRADSDSAERQTKANCKNGTVTLGMISGNCDKSPSFP